MNPPSERRATGLSTSVGCVLGFAPLAPTTRLRWSYLDECPLTPPRIGIRASLLGRHPGPLPQAGAGGMGRFN